MASKFAVGDTCYFDDGKGEVLGIRLSGRGPDSWDVRVWWDDSYVNWTWESDLLTQAEYDAFDEA